MALSKVEADLGTLKETFIDTNYIISYVVSKLVAGSYLIKDGVRLWKRNIVSASLMDFFNITTFCNGMCPLEHAKPKSCVQSDSGDRLYLSFRVPLINPSLKVLEPDSFKLMIKRDGKTCSATFTGVKNLIASVKEDCIYGINVETRDPNIYIFDANTCQKPKELPDSNAYFSITNCVPSRDNDWIDFVQVKTEGDNVCIYCPLSKISIGSFSQLCPDSVFSLRIGTKFEINGVPYEEKTFDISYNFSLDPHISLVAQLFVKPNYDWESLYLNSEKSKPKQAPPPPTKEPFPPLATAGITFSSVVAFVYGVYKAYKKVKDMCENDLRSRSRTPRRERGPPLTTTTAGSGTVSYRVTDETVQA